MYGLANSNSLVDTFTEKCRLEIQSIMQTLPVAVMGTFTCTQRSPYVVGTVAQLKCNKRYGSNTKFSTLVLKQGQLQWDPPSVTCVPALDELPVAETGYFTCDDSPPYVEGTVAKLKCGMGYLSGNITSTVEMKNGKLQWSIPFAKCVGVSCPKPKDLVNGKQHGLQFSFPNAIWYTCNEGYKLNSNTNVFYCNVSGIWSPPDTLSKLRCDPIKCPELQNPVNGLVDYTERTFESIAHYKCNDGYAMTQGEAVRICQGNGKWSGKEVECTIPHCPVLPDMIPFVALHTPPLLILDCGQGETHTLKCLPNGQWSKKPPYCQDVVKPVQKPVSMPVTVTTPSQTIGIQRRAAIYPPVKKKSNENVFWILLAMGCIIISLLFWIGLKHLSFKI